MARRNWQRLQALGLERKMIFGRFFPDTANAPTVDANSKVGWSVARTAAGSFTITFEDKYDTLVSFVATLQLASGDDKAVQIGTYTAASRTIVVRVWDTSGAGNADVAANANNSISFIAVFKNTGVPDVGL